MKAVRYFAVGLFAFSMATVASAQATRTWVSGVGDDVNPCSRTAPCKTFAGAISKTAAGGEISVLDPGGFGTLTITKAITLDGTGTLASILNSGVPGVTINAPPTATVTLRNLSINGAGTTIGTNGVRVLQAGKVVIEGVNIFGSQNGILVDATTAVNISIHNSYIHDHSLVGISVVPSSGTPAHILDLDNVVISGSGQSGFHVSNGATANASNSSFIGNGIAGVFADASAGTGTINLHDCLVSGNQYGLYVGNGGVMRIQGTMISNNTFTGVFYQSPGNVVNSAGNNMIFGNGGNNTLNAGSNVGMQ
jgi:hypothetical protein